MFHKFDSCPLQPRANTVWWYHYHTDFNPFWLKKNYSSLVVHTKLYAQTACLSIQQTLIFKTDKKSLCEFTKSVYMFLQIKYQPNITNGGGTCMIWGVRIAIFTKIRHLVKELITFLSIFGPQILCHLTAGLNKSLSISTWMQWEGISV